MITVNQVQECCALSSLKRVYFINEMAWPLFRYSQVQAILRLAQCSCKEHGWHVPVTYTSQGKNTIIFNNNHMKIIVVDHSVSMVTECQISYSVFFMITIMEDCLTKWSPLAKICNYKYYFYKRFSLCLPISFGSSI